jgi:hypothetical protein
LGGVRDGVRDVLDGVRDVLNLLTFVCAVEVIRKVNKLRTSLKFLILAQDSAFDAYGISRIW